MHMGYRWYRIKRAFRKLFSSVFDDSLEFIVETECLGNYGHVYNKRRRILSMEEYFNDYVLGRERPLYLAIPVMLGNTYFPMVDIDNEKSFAMASVWLAENKIDYGIIESSPNHFWIFPNRTYNSSKAALKFSSLIPGNDHKFLSTGDLFVRGLTFKCPSSCKTEFYDGYPIIRSKSKHHAVDTFMNKLIQHYNSKEMNFIYRYQSYREGRIDLADPSTGAPVEATLDELGWKY